MQKKKKGARGEIKAVRAKSFSEGLGMEIFFLPAFGSEDERVVLYVAEAVDGIPPSETGRKSAGW